MIGVLVPPETGAAIIAATEELYASLHSLAVVVIEVLGIRHTTYLSSGIDSTTIAVTRSGEQLRIASTTEPSPRAKS